MISDGIVAVQNRTRSEIITSILETAREGTTKTKMMYKAYLSHVQLVEYLTFLQEHGLVRCEKGTQLYKLTENGRSFLSAW